MGKVKVKEKDQKVKRVVRKERKEEKEKALKVMEMMPNTTLKEKVVEKVKVTGDPKKIGKEKTGDPKEKNTTSKKKMMVKDQDQKVKVVKVKVKENLKETGMMKNGTVNGKNQKVKVTGETGKTKKMVTGRNLKVVKVKAKAKVKAKVKEVRKAEKVAKEEKKTPSITSKKVLKDKMEKDQEERNEEEEKAQKVMAMLPNTTLKEKVVEKVKVTGDPKKIGKEKTGDPKEKNTTSKKKMMVKDQD